MSPRPASTAEPPVRVRVPGRTRWALWWADELADDPRFTLLAHEPDGEPAPDALVRCEAGRVTVEVPPAAVPPGAVPPGAVPPGADALPFRPARFTAAFDAARTAVARLGGSPRDFTLVEHTQTPLGQPPRGRGTEHGTAADRLEARLDELLALSDWETPHVVHATHIERGEEVTWAVRLTDANTGGTASVEIVRGTAVRWESGWSLRTPAGAYHAGTLTTREPGGELAARPWTGADSSPLDALHGWAARGAAWPVTAAQAARVAALMDGIEEARA